MTNRMNAISKPIQNAVLPIAPLPIKIVFNTSKAIKSIANFLLYLQANDYQHEKHDQSYKDVSFKEHRVSLPFLFGLKY